MKRSHKANIIRKMNIFGNYDLCINQHCMNCYLLCKEYGLTDR